ncbi:hypothetical protein V1520DRAFT_166196 [Lipomyces starkeyi]|uniref:Uncharacterized protein n=1 Tax=Lipomyces starkeyi NRRL Y-11557 TaxID=675824 RepID=A0A1E3QAD5_LIPST|nr:hypothetical protein LIPSTDRAFT_254808 [Lipomyces starkeyi NRRL Y-11557]
MKPKQTGYQIIDNYYVCRVPIKPIDSLSENVRKIVQLFRDLRLHALQDSKQSFASRNDHQSARSPSYWLAYVLDSRIQLYGLVDKVSGEWIAQLVFHGPYTVESYHLPFESGQLSSTTLMKSR